ncbi:MAG TPA: FG-GAP-like repeat-containing protein [Chitinophagales bacterium]|nr:FG-GAP-like repeat-containing protein [Chitinophagales bacterium]
MQITTSFIKNSSTLLYCLLLWIILMNSTNVGAQISFGLPHTLGEVHNYQNINIGDMNNDGWLDVVLADTYLGFFVQYNQEGTLNHTAECISQQVLLGYENINIMDINNDNKLDIIYSKYNDIYGVLQGDNGQFEPEQLLVSHITYNGMLLEYNYFFLFRDINDDGLIDAIYVNSYNYIGYAINIGNGQFEEITIFIEELDMDISNMKDIQLLDMNNDGQKEIIIVQQNGILLGNPNSNLDSLETLVEGYFGNVLFEDINNDSLPDVVFTTSSQKIAYMLNNGGTFSAATIVYNAPLQNIYEIKIANINNDNYKDILFLSNDDNTIKWCRNINGQSFDNIQTLLNATNINNYYVADMDNNDTLDIIVLGHSTYVAYAKHINNSFSFYQVVDETIKNIQEVFTIDLNEDSYLDLLLIGDYKISWYENNENQSFSEQRIIYIGDILQNSVFNVADYNDDGYNDIVYTNNYSINIFMNNGNTTFAPPNVLYYGNISSSMIFEDLNNDQRIDILGVSQYTKKAYYLLNMSDGTFALGVNDYVNANQVAAGDVDGDGDKDLLFYDKDTYRLKCLHNNGGAFVADTVLQEIMQFFSAENPTIRTLNANNDDRADIAFFYQSTIRVYLGQADGSYETLLLEHNVESSIIADYDQDGLDDIVISNAQDKLLFLCNTGNDFELCLTLPNKDVTDYYFCRIDNNNNLELIEVEPNHIIWMPNMGVTSFDEHIISLTAQGARCVYTADLNNDGFHDILSASENDNKIAWYRNNRDRTFSPEIIINTAAQSAQAVKAADIDNDGWIDVVSVSSEDNTVSWYRNHADETFGSEQVISTQVSGAIDVAVGDINKDGWQDIVAVGATYNWLSWFKNNGNGTWTSVSLFNNLVGAKAVELQDVNNDGWLDIALIDRAAGKLLLYQSAENATEWNIWLTDDQISPNDVHIAEVNAIEPNKEILSCKSNNNVVEAHFWLASNIEIIAQNVITPSAIYSADINQDSDNDIIVCSYTADAVYWVDNYYNHDRSQWNKHIITTNALGATSVYAADLDNDGDQDILSASLLDDKIAWYENKRSDFPVGIKPSTLPNAAANTLHLYPNPTHDQVVVESPQNEGKPYTLSLYSIEGRLLWQSSSITHSLATVDMGTYPSGMYLLQWQGEQQTIAARCIKS